MKIMTEMTYFSSNGREYVIHRSYGITPNENNLGGMWAVYDRRTGELVDFSAYIHDLLEKWCPDDRNDDKKASNTVSAVVPVLDGQPLVNATGSNETECYANLSMIDLSDEQIQRVVMRPSTLQVS